MDWGKSAQGVFPDEDQKALFEGAPSWRAPGMLLVRLVATITDQLTTNTAAIWDAATGSTLKVFACDIRVQSLALITHNKGEALVLASKQRPRHGTSRGAGRRTYVDRGPGVRVAAEAQD